MSRKILISSAVILTAFALPKPAYALNIPGFTSCVNAGGTLKVSYDSGVHGVPGMNDQKTGSDKVYSLVGNQELTQCFCPENGNGIQTNWWKVDKLSDADIQKLKSEGWIYVGDGSAWGLDSAPYLAKNSDYNCKPTSTKTVIETKTEVKTVEKQVLSLASTGNIMFLYATLAAAVVSTLAGITLRLKRS